MSYTILSALVYLTFNDCVYFMVVHVKYKGKYFVEK